uniref:Uncharacterized protein n=1 Tax=Haptolina brevifila TaxID=156173 RepID=A0A7S2IRH2_9EUKA|mmetsp:Transcript_69911/g.138530  ORF Transcript_69911/g.138530 Transcript_69911/m.138530 type:complete len:233 (+) Transcript_69911:108-806(+)
MGGAESVMDYLSCAKPRNDKPKGDDPMAPGMTTARSPLDPAQQVGFQKPYPARVNILQPNQVTTTQLAAAAAAVPYREKPSPYHAPVSTQVRLTSQDVQPAGMVKKPPPAQYKAAALPGMLGAASQQGATGSNAATKPGSDAGSKAGSTCWKSGSGNDEYEYLYEYVDGDRMIDYEQYDEAYYYYYETDVGSSTNRGSANGSVNGSKAASAKRPTAPGNHNAPQLNTVTTNR